ncbi:hypothetical protein BaRGS_00010299 [Batillaria attramentaria]|uniref:Uncharacterized protein n=1 Tax=Batillaria attramentaria TaxID=370345 RepID=A0ABD0LG12_9CAEN
MEAITDEVLMELILDDSLDCFDLAVLIEGLRRDEQGERADFRFQFQKHPRSAVCRMALKVGGCACV